MNRKRLLPLFLGALVLIATGCGGSDASPEVAAVPTEAANPADPAATTTATDGVSTAGEAAATPGQDIGQPTPLPAFVGEWPNRFCVDASKVETTLNLRSGPSTDTEVLASIPRSSCDLLVGGPTVDNGFQPVIYTTTEGAIPGWVSSDFIEFQDPPTRMEAAALLLVSAWQVGADTSQYTYGVDVLPTPFVFGNPVLVEGRAGFGCVLEGDITVVCAIALVEDDGTEVGLLELTGTQRGTNGYDGPDFFPADFPDGPTIESFTILDL